MAVSDTSQQYLATFSLKTNSFLAVKEVMHTSEDGEFKGIDALAISANEKHVYFADNWTNDMHIRDIGTLKEVSVKKGQYFI